MSTLIANISFEDRNGIEYSLDIWHKETYEVTTIQINSIEYCRQIWKGPDNDVPIGIYKHHLEVNALIENSTMVNLLTYIINAFENDIWAVLTKGTDIIFRGYILSDVVKRENRPYPFFVSLTFTDSLGKGSELKYIAENLKDLDELYPNIVHYLHRCLHTMGVTDLYDTTDTMLRTVNALVPSDFINTLDDWLHLICPPVLGFYEDEAKTTNYKKLNHPTIEKVISELCRLMNARFYYANDVYVFENIDARFDDYTSWLYGPVLTDMPAVWGTEEAATNQVITIDHDNHKILTGGDITLNPAIKEARCVYPFTRASIYHGYLWDADNYNTLEDIVYLSDVDNKVHFAFDYVFQTDYISDDRPAFFRMKFTIKVGDYYLKNADPVNYGVAHEWTLVASAYYQDTGEFVYLGLICYYRFAFQTIIPEAGVLSVNVEFEGIFDIEGNEILDINVTKIQNTVNYLEFYSIDNSEVSEIEYVLVNNIKNYKVLEYTGIFLDYPKQNEKFSLRIWDNDPDVKYSETWTLGIVEASIQIMNLRTVLQLREKVRNNYMMTLRHLEAYPTPVDLILYGDAAPYSQVNMITNLEFDCVQARSAIELVQFEKGTEAGTESETSYSDLEMWTDPFNNTTDTDGEDAAAQDNYIRTTALLEVGNVMQVYITPLIGNYFEGDILKIYSPAFRQPLEVMLNTDAYEGETTLEVFTVENLREYPIGSMVLPNQRPVFKTQYFSPVTAAFVEVTVVTLPDEALLSLTAMRRKLRVWHNELRMNYVPHGSAKLNYNDFSSEKATGKIHFKQALTGVRIIVEIEN